MNIEGTNHNVPTYNTSTSLNDVMNLARLPEVVGNAHVSKTKSVVTRRCCWIVVHKVRSSIGE